MHVNHPAMVEALEGLRVRSIAVGNNHSVACTEDERVMVWGRCDRDQVGASLDLVPENVLLFDERGYPRIVLVPVQIPCKYSPLPLNAAPMSGQANPYCSIHGLGGRGWHRQLLRYR